MGGQNACVARDTRGISGQGLVSRKSRELFGPEKSVVKLQSTCFEKLIFLHVFNIRTKRTVKFEGLESRRCEDKKATVAPVIGPKSFGTFEKQAPGVGCAPVFCSRVCLLQGTRFFKNHK